jgi:SAM-dependent methyltransferase
VPDPRWPHLDPLRLNLGSAIYFKPGWLNVDALDWDGSERVDFLRSDLREPLPFADGSVGEAYAGHLLEHLPKPLVLVTELYRVLAPGARCGLVVPDADVAWRHFRDGRLPEKLLEDIVGRLPEGEYGHHNVWSQDGLFALCWVAGFRRIEPLDRYHDPRLTAPADWQAGVDVWR